MDSTCSLSQRTGQVLVILNLPAEEEGVETTVEVKTRETVGPSENL